MAAGSIRKVVLDGTLFNVAGDANISKTPSSTIEAIRHSGGNMRKETLNTGQAESITLIIIDTEYEVLESIRDKGSIAMSYTKNNGSVWSTGGFIHIDNYESEENRCDITMFPNSGTWNLFGA